MTEVSVFRLYVMRATYLLIAIALGAQIWPIVIAHARPWSVMHGVALCMLATVTLLAALGVRYPLKMLPLLFFDLTWKAIWLIVVALPLWQAGKIDPDTSETVFACLMGIVIFPLAIPWPYAYANYVRARGDRWK